ncbi:MAG: FG-GAP-like repeat-containing protein [Pseudomonadota bacterium]
MNLFLPARLGRALRSAVFFVVSAAGLTLGSAYSASVSAATPPALSSGGNSLGSSEPRYYGGLAGSATVSAAGNAVYALPIELPHAAGGFKPNLSLNYNSNVENGLLGMGWFLSGVGSSVTRCNATIETDGYSHGVDNSLEDRFCLDGNKLLLVSGSYGVANSEYRTETDQFSKITAVGSAGNGPAEFRVRTKDGRLLLYGTYDKARVEAEGSTTVRKWRLHQAFDQKGNRYLTGYVEDNNLGHSYPSIIHLNENPAAGSFRNVDVVFEYENRPDDFVSYQAGSEIHRHPKRLKRLVMKVNGVSEYKYEFGYSTAGTRDVSRLTTVTKCDWGGVCQDPLTIEWDSSSGGGYSYHNQNLNHQSNYSTWYSTYRWHDLNGDGRDDYVRQHTNGQWRVMLSTPGGYSHQTWNSSVGSSATAVYWVDIDQDGKTDLIEKNASGVVHVSRSTGAGFTPWGGTVTSADPSRFIDVNGDKLPDLISIGSYYSVNHTKYDVSYRLNTGNGFGSSVVWRNGNSYSVDIADYDGDGLADLMATSRLLFKNDGVPQGTSAIIWGPSAKIYPSGSGYAMLVDYGDYNQDGLRDRKTTDSSNDWVYQINNGSSFEPDISAPNYIGVAQEVASDMNSDGTLDEMHWWFDFGNRSTDLTIHHVKDLGSTANRETHAVLANHRSAAGDHGVLDKNGDGFGDYFLIETYEVCTPFFTGCWYTDYEENKARIYQNTGDRLNLVKKITESNGREIEFEYDYLASGSSTYTKGSGAVMPLIDLQDSTRIVKRLITSDGIGGTFDTVYTYEGYRWDLDRRQPVGFSKITAENVDTGMLTITEYEQSFPYAMQPKKIERVRKSDSRLVAESIITNSIKGTPGGPVHPYISNRIDRQYALNDGDWLATTTTTRVLDDYGNVTYHRVWTQDDESNGESRQTITDNIYFPPDLTNWWIGQLEVTETQYWKQGGTDPADNRRTDFTYYPGTGLLKTATRQPGGGVGIEMTTTYDYDDFGNVEKETISGPQLATRATDYDYDPRGQFPITITNALGHVTSQTWDPVFGNRKTVTDPNGQQTVWTYDGFGNVETETRPDGTTRTTTMHKDPTGSNAYAHHYTVIHESGKPARRIYTDKLGRTTREMHRSFDGAGVNVYTRFSSEGRVWRVSEPFYSGAQAQWNTFGYDDLGRVTSLSAVDATASTTTVYDGFTTAVIDSANRTSYQYRDVAGRTVRTVDKDGVHLVMSYDAQGNRHTVTSAAGTAVASTVTYEYDRYGRMKKQIDGDHGEYRYTYDVLGNKLTEQSPLMRLLSQPAREFEYDKLGRMEERTDVDGVTTWVYDVASANSLGIGRLSSETIVHTSPADTFSKTYTYDPAEHGRLTKVVTSIHGTTYEESMTYDANGKLLTQNYPSSPGGGFSVSHTYNDRGYLERVQSPGGANVYYQTVATNAQGRITQEWLGDGTDVTTNFEGTSARVESQLSLNTATVQSFSYDYDASGNMEKREDTLHGLEETFTYDNLDRLRTAQVTGQQNYTYNFDESGNMTDKRFVAQSYDYLGAQPHAVTLLTQGATSRALSYDDNGNFLFGTNEPDVTWSSYNKPTQLTKGSITYEFKYGTDRRRYKKTRGSVTTHYVGSRFEKTLGSSPKYRSVVYANGRAVMVRKYEGGMNKNQYLHRDHLGSVTAITDEATGNVLDRQSYDAWGLRRIATTWAAGTVTALDHRGYTGHEHLDDIGIIHMNGRIYSPSIGRMLSPDPVTQEPENGQNYNRYSYAFNNPLRYTDPSGYFSEDCLNMFGANCADIYENLINSFYPDPFSTISNNVVPGEIDNDQSEQNGCNDSLSLGGFCGNASLGGILVAQLEGGDVTQANSEIVRAEFASQLVEHLDSELDEFVDYIGSLNRTQFQRRFGFEREGTIGLYRIQLGDLRGALVRKTVEDFVIESGINVIEYLVPKPKIGGKLGLLVEITDFFLPDPPVFDLSGFTVDCRGSTCGVVTPSDDLVVIKKR